MILDNPVVFHVLKLALKIFVIVLGQRRTNRRLSKENRKVAKRIHK